MTFSELKNQTFLKFNLNDSNENIISALKFQCVLTDLLRLFKCVQNYQIEYF